MSTKAIEAYAPTISDTQYESIKKQALVLAKTDLVPKALKDKPSDIVLIGIHAIELGIPFTQGLAHLFPIEGRICPSAQLQAALIRRSGHEMWVEYLDDEKCTVKAVRRGSKRELSVTYTTAMADRAGLLDEWVEKWETTNSGKNYKNVFVLGREGVDVPEWAQREIAAGRVKKKENWWKYRQDMLRARAISMMARSEFSDLLLGLGGTDAFTAEELGDDGGVDVAWAADEKYGADATPRAPDPEDDIEDAVLVNEDQPGAGPPQEGKGADGADGDGKGTGGSIGGAPATAPSAPEAAESLKTGHPAPEPEPATDSSTRGEDAAPAPTSTVPPLPLAGKEFSQSFAIKCGEAGVGEDDERHAIIRYATNDRVESSKEVRTDEVDACYRAVSKLKQGRLRLLYADDGTITVADAPDAA